jgi:tripartite-type tricarboxylate transporter receptor subunit TctC
MRRRALLGGLAAGGLARAALAQPGDWPGGRSIRWIVPYPPGGPADVMGRLSAQKLSEALRVPVVVENRSGASGTVGAEVVRQAAPDGLTFLAAPSVHVMGRHVLRAVPYDPIGDFTPVVRYGQGPLLVLANPAALPVATIAEALPILRAQPRRFSFGVSALGAANHLALVEFNRLTGLDLLTVTYRGAAPAMTDLISGQVQLMIDPIIAALPHVRDGRLRALAVTSDTRSSAAPEVPTARESGLPGLEFFSWYGVWGPRGLPAPIAERVHAIVAAGMREPDAVARLASLGFETAGDSPAEFARYIEADVSRSAELLRVARFVPE